MITWRDKPSHSWPTPLFRPFIHVFLGWWNIFNQLHRSHTRQIIRNRVNASWKVKSSKIFTTCRVHSNHLILVSSCRKNRFALFFLHQSSLSTTVSIDDLLPAAHLLFLFVLLVVFARIFSKRRRGSGRGGGVLCWLTFSSSERII